MPELPEPDYVNADIVRKHGTTATVIDPGSHQTREGEKGPYTKAFVRVEFLSSKATKTFELNKASENAIKQAWGSNTDHWVGKTLKFLLEEKTYKGNIRFSVTGRPATSEELRAALGAKEEQINLVHA